MEAEGSVIDLDEETGNTFCGLHNSASDKPSQNSNENSNRSYLTETTSTNSADKCVTSSSKDSTGSTSEKQKLEPIPVVDAEAIQTLENKTKELDRNVSRMMSSLNKHMNGISSTSVEYVECYRDSVKNIGNMTDTTTKAMAKLIAKCEEMNRSMEPLYSMSKQVKAIKSLLDQFEELCK